MVLAGIISAGILSRALHSGSVIVDEQSRYLLVQLSARLMGTEFSFLDLLAYIVGIACIYLVDRF